VELVLGLGLVVLMASLGLYMSSRRRRAHLRVWRRAASRARLTEVRVEDGSLFEGEHLLGRSGDLQVRLGRYKRGDTEEGTKIVVSDPGRAASGLSLRREDFSTTLGKRVMGEREIEVGDPAFDEEYYVQGEAPLALALLDAGTRRRLAVLLRGSVPVTGRKPVVVDASLSDGVLEVRVKESGFSTNRERVPEVLAHVLEVARQLVAPRDVAARIASNLRTEAEAGVRLRAVQMLAREFPGHPATREALLAACEDASDEVRLYAALALGEEGRETLLGLVESAQTGDPCAARAIAALGERLPAERVEAALRRALRGAVRPQMAQACLEALGRLGRPEPESLLLQALASEDRAVSVAAARALGRAGTVAAVAALREAAGRGGDLRGACRQAIAEIQARATGAEPGQLSLAGVEAGALSLADGEPGRLSLPEEEPEKARKPGRGQVPD
jgi:HEAT repeat protein